MSNAEFHGGDSDILYSSADHVRVKDLFRVQVIFMTILAQIPAKVHRWLPSSLTGFGHFLARLYCGFIIGQTGHLAILFAKTTLDTFDGGRLEEITDALTLTIIYTFACYATCYWLWRSQSLERLLARINRKYRHHSMAGLTYVSAYPAYVLGRKISIWWQAACISGVLMWAMAPIILRSRTLPLKCWYPFDPMQPFVYEFVYLLQLLGQINMGCIFGNGSGLFLVLVLVLLAQFDVLFCSLKNLDYHAQLLSGEDLNVLRDLQKRLPMGLDDELNQYLFAEECKTDLGRFQRVRTSTAKSLRLALHESLVECVRIHRFVLESCDTLEELFNPYCLVKSLQITLQLCLLAFVGVVGERSTVRVVNQIQYLALTLTELLMFTYCGELLRSHSVRSGEAFWRSQWWQSASAIRNDVLIFLVNSRRVVKMTAGKFYMMDVERLRLVITQAFSFLTLLQKLAAKNSK